MPRWDDITGEISGITLRDGSSGRLQPFERNRPYLVVLSGANMGQMFSLEGGDKVLGRGHRANLQLVDEGISRQHAVIRARPGDPGRYWIEDLRSRNGTFCNGQRIREHRLYDGDKIQLGRGVMLRFGYQDQFDESFQRTMQESALRDALTHTYNKRYFHERLEGEVRFARRHRKPLSLILMDLDHFKEINDRYGHLTGDQVLREFAHAIQRSIRNEDVLARYGGEEFALISRAITLEDGCRMAERLRSTIEGLVTEYHGNRIRITVSLGIAALPEVDATTSIEFIDAADRALYAAKTEGRNRVALYRPDLDERPTQLVELETHPPRSAETLITELPEDTCPPVRLPVGGEEADAAEAERDAGANGDGDAGPRAGAERDAGANGAAGPRAEAERDAGANGAGGGPGASDESR